MRQPFDLYTTHSGLTQALLNHVSIAGVVAEPCVGLGHMSSVLETDLSIAHVITNDIDPTHTADYHDDARIPEAEIWSRQIDWVVTNPPFSDAAAILPIAFEKARVGVAFLLRLTFLEPCPNRAKWLKTNSKHMSHLIVFGQPRPSFTGNGTDSATVAWMVWNKKRFFQGCNTSFVTGWQNG